MARWAASLILTSAAVVSGCNCDNRTTVGGADGGTDGGTGLTGLQSIALSPANATLTINGTVPATATYTATGTFAGGGTRDITAQTTFSLADPTLGGFSGSAFTSGIAQGGITTVQGMAGGLTGTTSLTLRLVESYSDPGSADAGLPSNAGNLFGGPDGGAAPQLVYPNDGVLLPPNLGKLEVHFLPGAGNAVFALSFENAITDVTVYLTCTTPLNGGCIYLPDPKVWTWLAGTNRGGAALAVTLRGTSGAGTGVGTSAPIHLSFSQDDINGGIYYWTTSGNTAIMRFDFASATQTTGQLFATPAITSGAATCIGCHALSRDGTKMVAESDGIGDGRLLLINVGNQSLEVPFPAAGQHESIFESWNPDGGGFVGVFGDNGATDYNLLLFDGATASPAATPDIPGTGTATNPADHPDWSPDGLKIAYVKVGIPQYDQRMFSGAIEMISTSDGAATWSTPVELVPSLTGKNRYYPAWSPDSAFLVFDESTCANPTNPSADESCDADSDPTATLFVVSPSAGATPIPLTRANAPGIMDGANTSLTNSFPKWSPFVFQRTAEVSSRLMWLTFSSSRNFGLRTPPQGGNDENPSDMYIWMVAIDPDQLTAGVDPSYPAFCLPFQDFTTSNHIAQWTTQIVGVIQ